MRSFSREALSSGSSRHPPLRACRPAEDLVQTAHTHIWDRFRSGAGVHHLSTSNVGNTYGAFLDTPRRVVPPAEIAERYVEQYDRTGEPYGLDPVVPTLAPLTNADGTPLPYLASNDVTAFSILDTGTGTITSYRFDTANPNGSVVPFDQFTLNRAR